MDKHAARLFQVVSLSLLVAGKWHPYKLVSPLTLISGDVRSGKSSLVEVFCYALGCTEGISLMPAIVERVKTVRAEVRIGTGRYRFERRVVRDGGSRVVIVSDLDNGAVERFPTRSCDDQRDISDFIFGCLEVPRELNGIMVGIDDLRRVFYLPQGEISRIIMNHKDSRSTRLTVIHLLLGLWDPDVSKLNARVISLKKAITAHKGSVKRTTTTLAATEATTEASLRQALFEVDAELAAHDLEAKELAVDIASLREREAVFNRSLETLRRESRRDLHLLSAASKNRPLGLAGTAQLTDCPVCTRPLPARQSHECHLCGQREQNNTQAGAGHEEQEGAGLEKIFARVQARAQEIDDLSSALQTLVKDELHPRLIRQSTVTGTLATAAGRKTELMRVTGLLSSLDDTRAKVADLEAERQTVEEEIASINEAVQRRVTAAVESFDEYFADVIDGLQMPFARSGRIDHATWLPMIDDNAFDQLSVDGGLKTLINVVYYAAFHSWAMAEDLPIRVPALLIVDTPSAGLAGRNGNGQALLNQMYRFLGVLHDTNYNLAHTKFRSMGQLLRDSYPLQLILIDNEHRSPNCPTGHHIKLTEQQPLIPLPAEPAEHGS